jgi:uncharacterized membrane protein YfcA
MTLLEGWWPLLAAILVTGAGGGVLAGLLGVGGGIVIVPVLDYALGVAGVAPPIRMPIAVATSLATIIPTSISSARAHARRGSVDLDLARTWAVPIAIGSAAGTLVASHVRSAVLSAVFGAVALIVAIRMLLPMGEWRLRECVPRDWRAAPVPAAIGFLSSMMGIGGGTISVPVMTLCGEEIHKAVGTAALFGLVVSLPATLGFLLATPSAAAPWGTIGLVSVPGALLMAPLTMLCAPLGARLAHSLSRRGLAIAFGLFLALVAIRMLYRTWNGH